MVTSGGPDEDLSDSVSVKYNMDNARLINDNVVRMLLLTIFSQHPRIDNSVYQKDIFISCTPHARVQRLLRQLVKQFQHSENKSNIENDVSSASGTDDFTWKKIRVLPTGVEPLTFWLLIQMLYLRAIGDLWELRPLN